MSLCYVLGAAGSCCGRTRERVVIQNSEGGATGLYSSKAIDVLASAQNCERSLVHVMHDAGRLILAERDSSGLDALNILDAANLHAAGGGYSKRSWVDERVMVAYRRHVLSERAVNANHVLVHYWNCDSPSGSRSSK